VWQQIFYRVDACEQTENNSQGENDGYVTFGGTRLDEGSANAVTST